MLIYVAGPMTTSGEPGPNMRQAADAARVLILKGHSPIVPHLSWILDYHIDLPREVWMRTNMESIRRCNGVLRLPGKSRGAEEEESFAISIGKMVWYDPRDVPTHEDFELSS